MQLLGRVVRDQRARIGSFALFVALILWFESGVREAIPGHAT